MQRFLRHTVHVQLSSKNKGKLLNSLKQRIDTLLLLFNLSVCNPDKEMGGEATAVYRDQIGSDFPETQGRGN